MNPVQVYARFTARNPKLSRILGPQHGGQRTGGLLVPGVLPSIKPNSRATTHPGVSGEIFIKFISHRRWTFALHQICQNDYEVGVNNLIPLFIWTHMRLSVPVLSWCFEIYSFNAQEYCSIEEHQEIVPSLH